MAPRRSPERDKAFEVWRDSGKTIPLKDIAEQLGVSETLIRKWKCQDKWEEKYNGNVTDANGNVTNQTNSNVTKKAGAPKGNKNALGHGAPHGNKNAVGNRGGNGAPPGNKNAEKHGLYADISNMVIPEEDIELFKACATIAGLEYELQIARYKVNRLIREQQNLEMMGVMGGPDGVENFRLKDDFYEKAIQQGLDIVRKIEAQIQKERFENERIEIERLKVDVLRQRNGMGEDEQEPIKFVDDIGGDDDAGS